MKTATSLLVAVIVASVLDKRLDMVVLCWDITKLCQQAVKVKG